MSINCFRCGDVEYAFSAIARPSGKWTTEIVRTDHSYFPPRERRIDGELFFENEGAALRHAESAASTLACVGTLGA